MRSYRRGSERPRKARLTTPGEQWADRRALLGLSERGVERLCSDIAEELNHKAFLVSDSLVRNIERKSILPAAAKFYSLCRVYQVNPFDAFDWYGIPFRKLVLERLFAPSELTALVNFDVADAVGREIPSPEAGTEVTMLVSELTRQWAESLGPLLLYASANQMLFGKVGKQDRVLFPLVLPGSLLIIDPTQTELAAHQQGSYWTRPIYFLELASEYVCGYCESLSNGGLLLRPHSDSPAEAREISPEERPKVVGRVTSVAIPQIDRLI